MSSFDFSYLFHNIPQSIVRNYAKESFQIDALPAESDSLNLFVKYHSNPLPESYSRILEAFSRNCFTASPPSLNGCFVIAADQVDLFRIIQYASSLACRALFEHLTDELASREDQRFKIRGTTWTKERPRVMAILNITPDSFFDGGKYLDIRDFGELAGTLIDQGADVLDIGGESSRPGARPVDAEEEIKRVLPVIRQIRSRFEIPISVDTVKPEVAEAALAAGADMVNDISGLASGKKMVDVLLKHDASYCLMHIRGTPATMQKEPAYSDVVAEVYRFFQEKLAFCGQSGLRAEKILIDPGIGFGKTFRHNMFLLQFLKAFRKLNRMILVGTSNKSFIGHALKREIDHRMAGTITTQALSRVNGAAVFRVHEVPETLDALTMTDMIRGN